MPGRRPMNASICSGLRRWSLVRSAALRSGLATISAMRSRLIVPAGIVDWHPATRTAADKTNPRIIPNLPLESQLTQRLQKLGLLRDVDQRIGFQPGAAGETGLQRADLLRFPARGGFVA